MNCQIEHGQEFLDPAQSHPSKVHMFYQDVIVWMLDTWKKHRDESIKIEDLGKINLLRLKR